MTVPACWLLRITSFPGSLHARTKKKLKICPARCGKLGGAWEQGYRLYIHLCIFGANVSCSPHITIGSQIIFVCMSDMDKVLWVRLYWITLPVVGVFAHALPMITATLSSATLSCLVLPVVHTYNVQSNISFISRPCGERERWGYSIEYVICFLVMQGARVEAGEAEGDKAVQRWVSAEKRGGTLIAQCHSILRIRFSVRRCTLCVNSFNKCMQRWGYSIRYEVCYYKA